MKSVISILNAAVLAAVLMLTSSANAFAEQNHSGRDAGAPGQWEAQAGSLTLSKNYFLNRDIEFQGNFGSDRTYIDVDKHWKISDAWLNLSLTASELSKSSALTVYVNDKPIHSELLTSDNERIQTLKIAIPRDAIKQGSNEIRMEVSQKQEVAACVEDSRDGRWVHVRDTSYVHLEFKERPAGGPINEYPYPFLKASASPESQSGLILIPDQADEEEIAAALKIASSLGARMNEENADLNLVRDSQISSNDKANYDIIYVGKAKHLPGEIQEKMTRSEGEKSREGAVIVRSASPYNAERTFMAIVADQDGGALDTAARLLMNQDLTSQIESDVHHVAKEADVSVKENASNDQMLLQDMGYPSGIYLEGPYRQQASIGIKLASNRLVVPGAKATLQIRYAQNLDFSKSLVTVYINGIPAGSKKLESENAGSDKIEVAIPNNAINSHYVEMKIAFDLQLTNEECARIQSDTPWAFIDAQSSIHLPTKDERALLLENYPWPFMKDGRFNDTVVVVPNEIGNTELDFLADMYGYLGKDLRDNTGELVVVKDRDFVKPDRSSNYIVVGTPDNVQAFRNLNASLWFKYDEGFGYFQSNEMRRLLESFSRNLASVQLVPNPGNPERGILFATAPLENNLLHAKKYLTEAEFASGMVGNALLVDRWDNATNHYFIEGDSLNIAEKVSFSSPELKRFAVIFGTVLLMIVIGGVWYWRKYRRR